MRSNFICFKRVIIHLPLLLPPAAEPQKMGNYTISCAYGIEDKKTGQFNLPRFH